MPRIFVNYRTRDEQLCAILIERELSKVFGTSNVFRASKSIPPGERFEVELLRGVWRSDALVAVIGKRWLDATDVRGERALDNPADWTRREIVEALSHHVFVIPLLVDGLPRLQRHDLPAALAGLADVQSVRFDPGDPDAGLRRLIECLTALDGRSTPAEPGSDRATQRGGIGSISANTVTAVTDPRGPVNTGSGNQFNQPISSLDGVTFPDGDVRRPDLDQP